MEEEELKKVWTEEQLITLEKLEEKEITTTAKLEPRLICDECKALAYYCDGCQKQFTDKDVIYHFIGAHACSKECIEIIKNNLRANLEVL